MAKKQCTWFIRPLDSFTNEIISRELDALGLTEESLNQVKISEGEEIFNVFEVPRQLINYLRRSKSELNLEFVLYTQEGRHGKIRIANWLGSKKKSKALAKR